MTCIFRSTPRRRDAHRQPHRHRGQVLTDGIYGFKGWLDLRRGHTAYRGHCRYRLYGGGDEQSQREIPLIL